MSDCIADRPAGVQRLIDRPFDFDFVQAVSVLQNSVVSDSIGGVKSVNARIGFDFPPEQEVVRFQVAPSLRSFSSEVLSVSDNQTERTPYQLVVPFIGLIGPNGVLPRHYTQTVIGRVKQHDLAMRDFYDLFHHRIISMFFRASVKYRLPYVYQATAADVPVRDDSITQLLRCLTGIGEPALKRRLSISDDHLLFYGGHFADDKPTAHSLQRIVNDFCGLPADVLQFQFEWLYIDSSEQTRFSATASNQLGVNMVIGERVPSWQSRFRLRLGPLDWQEFLTLLPDSPRVIGLAELVRGYVGIDLDFDLQVAVQGSEVPPLELSDDRPVQLGWTTWIFSKPMKHVVEDAVFDIGKF